MHLAHDDLVALAASLTGLVGIPAAVLAFYLGRALDQRSKEGVIRLGTAVIVMLLAAYALVIDIGAWWAWTAATKPKTELVAGVGNRWAYGVAFGPLGLFAASSGAWALWLLIRRGVRALTSSHP